MRTGRPRVDVRERILAKIVVDEETGCWLWQGYVAVTGYGQIGMPLNKDRSVPRMVHRVAYEAFVGPIPDGLTIDHVYARGCRHRHCANPAHLEPVTMAENNQRRPRVQNGRCPAGHRYDALDERGVRICRRCRRASSKRWRQRMREAVAV